MVEPTNKVIKIEKVSDLIQLDDRQLDACLSDLRTWVKFNQDLNKRLKIAHDMLEKLGASPEDAKKLFNATTQGYMKWVDDGVNNGKIKVTLGGKTELATLICDKDGNAKPDTILGEKV